MDDDFSSILDQLDGNISFVSCNHSDPLDTANISHNIPVHTGFRPHRQFPPDRLPPVRKRIRRDNKVLQAASLPKISIYNMHSLMPNISTQTWMTGTVQFLC